MANVMKQDSDEVLLSLVKGLGKQIVCLPVYLALGILEPDLKSTNDLGTI